MTYRAKAITQRDGSSLQNSNCLMAVAAVGLDYHTLGDKLSDGAKMRSYSGDPDGGTSTDDLAQAWRVGYDETARQRDGHTWDDAWAELEDGRLVMLQVWHATMGGPCLSGSGAYGHGIAVAPERHSDGRWLVSDPWCKPASWTWWEPSKLRAGAEEWATRCAREASGGDVSDIRELRHELVVAAAKRLLERWTPAHPGPQAPPLEAGGGTGILYASSAAHTEASDMAVQAPDSLTSDYTVEMREGDPFYRDSDLREKAGSMSRDATVTYIGLVVGASSRAILVSTGSVYSDPSEPKPTIVYVPEDSVDPVRGSSSGGSNAERDSQWRRWLEDDPEAPDRA